MSSRDELILMGQLARKLDPLPEAQRRRVLAYLNSLYEGRPAEGTLRVVEDDGDPELPGRA